MTDPRRTIASTAAAFGGLGVIAGAFGAHALKATLGADRIALWQTAVDYQIWHALALLALAALAPAFDKRPLRLAGMLFTLGIVLFSGSLYLLALGAPRMLGLVTPFGGLALIGGWLALGWAGLRRSPSS